MPCVHHTWHQCDVLRVVGTCHVTFSVTSKHYAPARTLMIKAVVYVCAYTVVHE